LFSVKVLSDQKRNRYILPLNIHSLFLMFFGDYPQIGEIQFSFHNSWQDQ
jgi:hypothetical protein